MELLVNLPAEVVLKALYNVSLYKNWHPEVIQSDIKMMITSENSAIVYMKTKKYSEWYR
jgi:hypothetical protein